MRGTLLVLAGGESRRMGRPKALLPAAEGTLIEHVVARLAPGFDQLLIAGGGPLPERLERYRIPDRLPRAGPLAGIEAGLAAARSDILFAVACDMPHVTAQLAATVMNECAGYEAAVPRVAGRPEPACAAYARGAREPIAAFLESGGRRAAEALARLRVNWLDDVDPLALSNLNTPAEYERWLAKPTRTEKHA